MAFGRRNNNINMSNQSRASKRNASAFKQYQGTVDDLGMENEMLRGQLRELNERMRMQDDEFGDEQDPLTHMDSAHYLDSLPFDRIESDSNGGGGRGEWVVDSELSALRPGDDGRIRLQN